MNCFVLLLQGLTYVVVTPPPETGSTISVYRSAFAAQRTCDLSPALAPTAGFAEDVNACGVALTTRIGVDFAHAALLFMVRE